MKQLYGKSVAMVLVALSAFISAGVYSSSALSAEAVWESMGKSADGRYLLSIDRKSIMGPSSGAATVTVKRELSPEAKEARKKNFEEQVKKSETEMGYKVENPELLFEAMIKMEVSELPYNFDCVGRRYAIGGESTVTILYHVLPNSAESNILDIVCKKGDGDNK